MILNPTPSSRKNMGQAPITPVQKYNIKVNILDGAFFGLAMGFASFVTILPLFVRQMTDSAILIGLIPAIHSMGWMLPQLLTSRHVSSLRRFKPWVLLMTIQERAPFLALALVAWFLPALGNRTALIITFVLLIWQGLGGGVTATGWQTMISKIMPGHMRGTFYGIQSAAANLLSSLSAILAGIILANLPGPGDFALLFLLASGGMLISWLFLAKTVEDESPVPAEMLPPKDYWHSVAGILKSDRNFVWFLVARVLSQFAMMGMAFYTVYSVDYLGMDEVTVGILTAVYLATQIMMNPLMGWLGDRWSHLRVIQIAVLAAILSALIAWLAPAPGWFFPAFILAGTANVAFWTINLALILEFGHEVQRPVYIGLANTLIAPAAILAPILGGWLADTFDYPTTFLVTMLLGILTAVVYNWFVRDPRKTLKAQPASLDESLETTLPQ
jgi:MFS family permease